MELDCYVRGLSAADIGAHARAVEDIGYRRLWSSEGAHEPFLSLVAAAATTSSIGLGTNTAVAFARSPMVTAQLAQDLQHISGGRFVLGLSSQVKAHIERRYAMPWSSPVERMAEYVDCLEDLWRGWQTGATAKHRGTIYDISLGGPNFDPGPVAAGPAPIMLGATGPRMLALAARRAGGVLCHPLASAEFVRQHVRPALAVADASCEVVVSPLVAVAVDGEDAAAAVANVRRKLGFYISTEAYRPMLAAVQLEHLQPQFNELARAGRWDDLGGLVDDDVLHRLAIAGTASDVGAELARRFAGVADRVAPIELDTLGRPRRDLAGLGAAPTAGALRRAFMEASTPT